jgi:1-acyl-sn-glycerol-3-phosphate acyltransferase
MPYAFIKTPDQMPRRGGLIAPWLGRTLMRLGGWKIEGELPNVPKLVITVGPHTSNWDFVIGMLAMWALDLKLSWIGKHSIFVWPFSLLLRSMGGIAVDRSAAHGVVGEIIVAMQQHERMWFALAPEGTRKKVAHFRSGFLHIAAGAQVPVVLASLDYRERVVGFGPLIGPPFDIEVELAYVENFYRSIPGRKQK